MVHPGELVAASFELSPVKAGLTCSFMQIHVSPHCFMSFSISVSATIESTLMPYPEVKSNPVVYSCYE